MNPIKNIFLVNIPQGDTDAVSFNFATNNQDGAWNFLLEWNGARWNGWATLPSGEVRQFGCIPGVINWTGFPDFGLVWLSSLAAFGQPDIFGASLVLIDWGP
jgi:hypothetical protein